VPSSLSRPPRTAQCARRRALALAVLAAGVACGDRANSAEDTARFDAAFRTQIASLLAAPDGSVLGERLSERETLGRFYAQRDGRPAWSEHESVRSDLALELLDAVRQSERHGLRPNIYHAEALARALDRRGSLGTNDIASLDVLLSDAFLHLARHFAEGAADPRSLEPDFERAPEPSLDTARALAAALDAGKIGDALAHSAPPHREYQALVRALARLRDAQAAGEEGAAARADQVLANLERWRWLPRELGRRHLRVNVASFALEAFDADEVRLAMRVVVGEKGWRTPLAHGAITHMVLNPSWRVPHSIATREMLPAAQRDRGYFRAKGIQVLIDAESGELRQIDPSRIDWRSVDRDSFRYHLRQPPGPHNPLGRIKFVFANPYGVYLHGTPGDLAFARGLRTLSHGCVRVEDEIALAEFALAPDPSWSRERLERVLRSAWEHRLPLPESLPVYLLYFTVSAQADGVASFHADPYGWDRKLIAALGAGSTPARTAASPIQP
jgi:murein L,D-transpeptidase YcbB/YkuD